MSEKQKENFVHLHTHSSASLMDGAVSIGAIVKEVATRGNPAVALTDHGTMRGLYTLTEKCNKAGIKAVHGIEFYVVDDLKDRGLDEQTRLAIEAECGEDEAKLGKALKEAEKKAGRSRYHLTAWAMDQIGLLNLYKMSSKAWIDGFYYKPMVDWSILQEFGAGVMIGTGCVSSVVNRPLVEGKSRVADSALGKLFDIFGDRLYVELMPHNLDIQRMANTFAMQAAQCGIKPIATQDAHYLKYDDYRHHEVLLAIGSHKKMSDSDRFRFDGNSYWLRTRAEMIEAFRSYHKSIPEEMITRALDNTVELAERCSAKIEINPLKGLLPTNLFPDGFTSDTAYFAYLIKTGIEWRGMYELAEHTAALNGADTGATYKVYMDRIQREFRVLKKAGFIPYFLMIHEICQWARSVGIAKGPGRGSAAGSIIAFLLGITDVDPILHGLMFERFIAPGRVNLPDCFPSGTRVLCRSGWIGIELIGVGDEVLTRFGWRKVIAKHSRMTRIGEGLIAITWRDFDGNIRKLTCTPNHPIFHNINGKIESTKAESQKPGSRIVHLSKMWRNNPEGKPSSADIMCTLSNRIGLCCMREGVYSRFTPWEKTKGLFTRLRVKNRSDQSTGYPLQGLRGSVSTTRSEPRGLLKKVSMEKPSFLSHPKMLRGMRKGIQKLFTKSKNLLETMWQYIGIRFGVESFSREKWVQEGSGAFCSFLTRGGLCKITQNKRNKIPTRISTYPYEERENLYSRFCRRGQDNRVEGLGGTGSTEDRGCKNGVRGSFHRDLLQRCSEGDQRDDPSRFSQVGRFRDGRREIRGFQDDRKTMSGMCKVVSNSDYSESRNMQSILCESQTENRSVGDGDSQGNRREVCGMFERDQDVQESKTRGELLLDRMHDYCEEGEIVDIRKKEGVWEVYDLTVEECHEYFAEGVLVHNCDLDFDDFRRDEIYEHLKDKYGKDRVAKISTSGRMAGRQAVKDVCRVLDVPYQMSAAAAGAIDQNPEDEHAIETALKDSDTFKAFARQYPEAVAHARALEGLTKSLGVHAAGVVVSPVPIVEVTPVETRNGDRNNLVTAFDMKGVEGVGLVKIDLLGLKTVRFIETVRTMIKERHGIDVDLYRIPLDDQLTLDGFSERDFCGIFQFDSSSSHYVCSGVKFRSFDDLAAINALNRPGGISFVDDFKQRHADQELCKKDMFHPKVTAITANAYGLMIYQEHVIRVATDVAGFSPGDADTLRKKIGKKEGAAAIEEMRTRFVAGCAVTTPDLGDEGSNRLFDYIVRFSRYGFNRAHAISYSLFAFWGMYLKKRWPVEFYCSLIVVEGDSKELQRYVVDAKNRYGIEVALPDINKSDIGLTVVGERKIGAALSEIKGINLEAAKHIIEVRKAGGDFKSFANFLERTQRKKVRKAAVLALINAGAFDAIVDNPRWFAHEFESLWKAVERKKFLQVELAEKRSGNAGWKWDEETRLLVAAEVCPIIAKPHPIIACQSWIDQHVDGVIEPITRDLVNTEKTVVFAGSLDEINERMVGDNTPFDKLPSEEEQQAIGYGQIWYSLKISGPSTDAVKVKVDKSIVSEFKSIFEAKPGTPVLVCGTTNPEWSMVNAHYIASIHSMMTAMKSGTPLQLWERLFLRDSHPIRSRQWRDEGDGRLALRGIRGGKKDGNTIHMIGVISQLTSKKDKKKRDMGFFSLITVDGIARVMSFAESWPRYRSHIKNGQLVRLKLETLDRGAYHLEGVRIYSVDSK